jgi:hypothetical protein
MSSIAKLWITFSVFSQWKWTAILLILHVGTSQLVTVGGVFLAMASTSLSSVILGFYILRIIPIPGGQIHNLASCTVLIEIGHNETPISNLYLY